MWPERPAPAPAYPQRPDPIHASVLYFVPPPPPAIRPRIAKVVKGTLYPPRVFASFPSTTSPSSTDWLPGPALVHGHSQLAIHSFVICLAATLQPLDLEAHSKHCFLLQSSGKLPTLLPDTVLLFQAHNTAAEDASQVQVYEARCLYQDCRRCPNQDLLRRHHHHCVTDCRALLGLGRMGRLQTNGDTS